MMTFKEYKFTDGQWTFKDSEMMAFYRDMDLIEDTFYNVVDPTKIDPLPYFKRVRFFLIYVDGVPAGAVWISGWNSLNKSGFFNFTAFKSFLKGLDLSRKVILCKYAVKLVVEMPDFQLIYGETSVSNAKSLAAAQYFGFKTIGAVPHAHWNARENRFEDTVMMYIDKDCVRN